MIFFLNKLVQWCLINMFSTYLHQEEGDAVCAQRPGQFDIFHFCFYLCHFSTVFVFLQMKLHLHDSTYQAVDLLLHECPVSLSREQRNRTWKIFFSAPLCLMYSLGRNSFRLKGIMTQGASSQFFCYSQTKR